jgi:hypothetical protein
MSETALIMPPPTGKTMACCLGRHDPETIKAIRDLRDSPWLLEHECEQSIQVGGKWCPGRTMRHDHISVRRCARCGREP